MKQQLISIVILSVIQCTAYAQSACPSGASNCSSQNMGDTTSQANNNQNHADQTGNTSNSNASGVNITGRNDLQQSNNAANNSLNAGGGTANANGNTSNNANHSSVGNTSSNSGGNTLSNGASSNSGGNTLAGGNVSSANHNSAAGGAGGAGGNAGAVASNGGNRVAGGNNSASLAGGNNSAGQSNGNGNKSVTNVDASSHSDYKSIWIPPVVPATPPSAVGATSAALTVTACGPLQRVVHTPVKGKFFGMLINSDVDQGTTDELEPVTDENGVVRYYDRVLLPDGRTHLMGTQAIISTAVIGTAGARNLALGAGGSSGAWGQGGMGSSSANQQTQTKITLRACEVGVIEPPAPPPLPIIANIRQ